MIYNNNNNNNNNNNSNNNNNNNNNNIPFICHIAESTELKGYKLQLKLLLL